GSLRQGTDGRLVGHGGWTCHGPSHAHRKSRASEPIGQTRVGRRSSHRRPAHPRRIGALCPCAEAGPITKGGHMATQAATYGNLGERRYDLDWVRIGAFILLIFYHVGMYYVTWDWHVKSPYSSHAVEPLMMLTQPWRLSLLFLVSGVATAYLLERQGPRGF